MHRPLLSRPTMAQKSNLRKIKILDPQLCVHCPLAALAEIVIACGERQPTLYCKRLDCDNWITMPAPAAVAIALTSLPAWPPPATT